MDGASIYDRSNRWSDRSIHSAYQKLVIICPNLGCGAFPLSSTNLNRDCTAVVMQSLFKQEFPDSAGEHFNFLVYLDTVESRKVLTRLEASYLNAWGIASIPWKSFNTVNFQKFRLFKRFLVENFYIH